MRRGHRSTEKPSSGDLWPARLSQPQKQEKMMGRDWSGGRLGGQVLQLPDGETAPPAVIGATGGGGSLSCSSRATTALSETAKVSATPESSFHQLWKRRFFSILKLFWKKYGVAPSPPPPSHRLWTQAHPSWEYLGKTCFHTHCFVTKIKISFVCLSFKWTIWEIYKIYIDLSSSQQNLIEMWMNNVLAFPENWFQFCISNSCKYVVGLIRSTPSDLFSVRNLIRTNRHVLHDWICLKSAPVHTFIWSARCHRDREWATIKADQTSLFLWK